MSSSVREIQAPYRVEPRPSDVVALARAGLLFRKMTATEFWGLMDLGLVGEGSFDHIELLGGEIVVKPMGKGNRHEKYKSAVVRWMVKNVPDEIEVGVEPTIEFSDDDVFEPDVVLYARLEDTKSLKGNAIALLVEIADSSFAFDSREKARRYALHGVQHYWVVDATRGALLVFSEPGQTGYASRRLFDATEAVVPPFAGAPPFRLADLGIPMPAAF